MKDSLDFHIVTPTSGVRDAVQAWLPSSTDERIYPEAGYQLVPSGGTSSPESITTSPEFSLDGMIRFNSSADHETAIAGILAESGMLDDCEVGTHIGHHDCTHDGTGGACVVTTVYEVTT